MAQQPATLDNRIVGALLGLVMAVGSAGISAVDATGDTTEAAGAATPAVVAEAAPTRIERELAQLVVEPESAVAPYDRHLFRHWVDDDADRCDTREEVLVAESLREPTVDPARCTVSAGEWLSAYDGLRVTDPGDLDIDHVVPLGEAWRSGADSWDSERRRAYANDLDEPQSLIAVTAGTNRSKGDKDPARWRPPDLTSWCAYATAWISVKVRWELTLDLLEAGAVQEMLATC